MSTENNVDESSLLTYLQNEINTIKENVKEITFNNRTLKKHINELTRENENLQDSVYYNEIKINSVDQYSRHSNVEIRNIPENITKQHRKICHKNL